MTAGCSRQVYRDESWGGRLCGRPAVEGSELCGPHLRGAQRSKANRDAWEAKRKAEDAQAAYVRAWRAEHPDDVWDDGWRCPLCNVVAQSGPGDGVLHPLYNPVVRHQENHGLDWQAYVVTGEG